MKNTKNENTLNSSEILNEINTKNLIEFIESSINDDMIMKNFFYDLKIIKKNNNEVFIKVENEKISNFIKRNYFDLIKDGIKQIYSQPLEVIYLSKTSKNFEEIITNKINNSNSFINSKYTFDNYIECEFNKNAIKAIKSIIENDEVIFNPIFIHSNSGLGKTHLLHALGNEILKKTSKSIIYINPDTITQKLTFFMKNNDSDGLNDLKETYKNTDILLFDDVQNFKNKEATLKIIFDIINANIENKKQIVICADKKPNELGGFEQRFISRFSGGLTIEMKKASTDDLKSILKFKVDDEKLSPEKWEEESYDFIAKNYSNSIRELIGALNKIKFYSSDFKKNTPYSYIVIKSIFSDLKFDKNNINEERIISVVIKYYKINKSDLLSKSRVKLIVLARDIAMWLIRNLLDLTLERIGEIFNNRTHSAVIISINRINNKLTNDINVKNAIKDIQDKINKI